MPSREPDRGLPRERTGLAWERSALVYATLAGAILGVAAHRNAGGLVPLGIAALAVAGAVWRHGRRAYGWDDVAPQPRALALMTGATALAAVAAVVVVLVRL
jgi:uncharacterized membrane protein YidH (DUF202 family)